MARAFAALAGDAAFVPAAGAARQRRDRGAPDDLSSGPHLRQLSGDFAASSYCEARQRLPLEVLTSLLATLVQWAQQALKVSAGGIPLLGQRGRVLIVDSSTRPRAELKRAVESEGKC